MAYDAIQNDVSVTKQNDHRMDRIASYATGQNRRFLLWRRMPPWRRITCPNPFAQRRRWFQSARRVSGTCIQTRARGSYRMSQNRFWRRQDMSMSSVAIEG